jgi:hypothetical protein
MAGSGTCTGISFLRLDDALLGPFRGELPHLREVSEGPKKFSDPPKVLMAEVFVWAECF